MENLNDRVQLELLSESISNRGLKVEKLKNEVELFKNYKNIVNKSDAKANNWVNFGNMFWSLDNETTLNYTNKSLNELEVELNTNREKITEESKKFQTLANLQ